MLLGIFRQIFKKHKLMKWWTFWLIELGYGHFYRVDSFLPTKGPSKY